MTRLTLGTYPTPVDRLPFGDETLFVKRDDLAGGLYGGNKTRKLEWLLGRARDLGVWRLVTAGAAGSHQILALSIFGAHHGFRVEGVLASQPASANAKANLRVALAHGLIALPAPSWALVPALVARRRLGGAHVVPLGGSNPLGSLGFVEAARELASQIASGLLPEPDALVVALGSGGTAAGLAVGLEDVGLRTRVVGVAISEPKIALGPLARKLAWDTARRIGLSPAAALRAARRIEVDTRWLGRGYGHDTAPGRAAMTWAEPHDLTLEGTYTAKACACALSRLAAGRTILYWHTASRALRGAKETEVPPLPPHLEALFR